MLLTRRAAACSAFLLVVWSADSGGARAEPSAAPVTMQEAGAPRPKPAIRPVNKAAAGIFPVYEVNGEWILVDRGREGRKRGVKPGRLFLVIGSRAAALFKVVRYAPTPKAACSKAGPARTPAYVLAGRAKAWLGTPVAAILPRGRVDPRKASVTPLADHANNDTYAALGKKLQERVLREITSGKFAMDSNDDLGQNVAQNPSLDDIHLAIDFASTIHLAEAVNAQALVTTSQFFKSSRRCLWLFVNDEPSGACAEMPNKLMAETASLRFVAYDPNRDGHPFLLAYTPEEPLWGHERWGFHMARGGPSAFLIDTLDPKCRQRL